MIMKKVWLVLLATVLVFGLAVLSCGGSSTPIVEEPLPPVDSEIISDFIKGLTGFSEFVVEKDTFGDGGPGTLDYGSTTDPNKFAQWTFDLSELTAADYFVFATDGSIETVYGDNTYGAKKEGFGGTQIGLQNEGGSYGMSTDKITTVDWTAFDRSGLCLFAVKVSDMPPPGTASGSFQAVTEGDLRVFVGYFSDHNICGLSPNGYAALVKGTLTKPAADSVDITNKSPEKVVGFCAKIPEIDETFKAESVVKI